MAKNLVLVESPAKAKTINKYLGRNYTVEATVGHIKNLPKTKLGVDVDKKFEPQYVTIRGKGDIVKKIKSLASKSQKIFIATDPDREGEAIAQDIADVLPQKNDQELFRVLFNEITKNGVKKGMNNPKTINNDLVASQRARRVMDRIIGYKISPFLWRAIIEESGNTLSAGRVQSVALRLICEREEEIEKFLPVEYWHLDGLFATLKDASLNARLYSIDSKPVRVLPDAQMSDEAKAEFYEKFTAITNEADAKDIEKRVKAKDNFIISDINKKQTKRNPSPPFITSSLQAEASKVLRMRASQTMGIAQKLYEGVEMGDEGTAGLITYMRTDSTRLSAEIIDEARGYVDSVFGKEYLPEKPNHYNKKKDGQIQDAHEAIRPTSVKYTPEFVKPYLDDKSFKLYQLIWMRFVASQMMPATVETTTVEISADEFTFRASGTAILFEGFMKVYFEQEENGDDEKDDEAIIPAGLEKNEKMNLKKIETKQKFTKPPPRFTESSLIKELENNGIGRPSTYSMIVGTIMDRNYVFQKDRKLQPAELGKKVNNILVDNFPNIFDVNFTSRMEDELDQIAGGSLVYEHVLHDFYTPFASALKEVEENMEKIICEKCGGEMDIKIGRFGKFLACLNYPECKNIKSLKEFSQEEQEPEYTGEKCPKCDHKLVFRTGRFGRFIGCSNYPDCDYKENITLDISCPKCDTGEVVERKSRRGKLFYGCSKYPDCDFISWYKPRPEKCPECGHNYLEERYSNKKGNYLKCPECSKVFEDEKANQENEA